MSVAQTSISRHFLTPFLHEWKKICRIHIHAHYASLYSSLGSHSCQNKFKTLFPTYNAANTMNLYCPHTFIKPYSLWPFLMGLSGPNSIFDSSHYTICISVILQLYCYCVINAWLLSWATQVIVKSIDVCKNISSKTLMTLEECHLPRA